MSFDSCINFTIDAIKKLPAPSKGIACYKDLQNPSLSLYVTTKGAKTFFTRKRVHGRDKRIRIGSFSTLTIEQARRQAILLAADIERGQDPQEEKRKKAAKQVTVGEMCADYIERHSKLRNKTWQAQEREIAYGLKPLLHKPRDSITRDEVDRLHAKIGQRSKVQANRIIGHIRAAYNHAIRKGWEGRNPAVGFQAFKEKSRDRFILPEEMPFLIQSLEEENALNKDFFWLLLLTGVRKTNLQQMRWEEIDWHFCNWRIPDTKNGQPLTLPLVEKAIEILKRRRGEVESHWVFPQEDDAKKCYRNPQKAWERIRARATLKLWSQDKRMAALIEKVRQSIPAFFNYNEDTLLQKVIQRAMKKAIELPPVMTDLRIHDLRRTFGSYQAMSGANLSVIGRSLGHKSIASTMIYARLNLDPVRASIQKAVQTMTEAHSNIF